MIMCIVTPKTWSEVWIMTPSIQRQFIVQWQRSSSALKYLIHIPTYDILIYFSLS